MNGMRKAYYNLNEDVIPEGFTREQLEGIGGAWDGDIVYFSENIAHILPITDRTVNIIDRKAVPPCE